MSGRILGAAQVLSCVVIERRLGLRGRLIESDEDEYTEDSDYEDETGLTGEPISGNIDSEQNREQRLHPVLKIGSSVA